MAGKTTLATLVLAVVASAALMEGAAATVYFVGDATSWTIPSGGAAFYSTWAANHTFAVGDILVFNFVTGAHDVATVTKTSYDSCSSASPIAIQTTGPANVTLTTSGEHYFICTVGQHCANGQKLSVNVPAAASSPTPTPSPSPASLTPSPAPTRSTTPSPTPSATPPPAPTPAAPTPSPTAHSPPPSSATTNSPPPPPAHSVAALHVIGNSLGWIVPPGGPIAYSTWASVQTFSVGDILMFNFTTGEQDVAIVTKEAYDTCNSTNPILLQTTGPANITLTSAGLHYFIGTIDRHCFLGQKLTVDVTGASGPTTSPAPTPPPPPPSPVVAEPPRAPMTYVVGDALGWIVRPGGPIAYSTWASGKTFFVGDTLVFNFKNGTQDVAQLTMAAYDSCNTTNPTNVLTNSPVSITLTTAGDYFFTSTYSSHCYLGQKLAITVVGTTSGPTSSPAPPPPSTPVPAPPRAPVTYVLLDKLGWIVPPGGLIAYSAWAHDKTFFVGDTLVFNFENGSHDVAEVTEAAYKSCNTTTPGLTLTTSPAKITLTAAGSYFFTSTYPHHCSLGQKLAINVTATSSPTSPPGSIAEPPSNALSPTAGSAPITSPSIAEPPSNAPSPTAGSEPITSPSIAEPPSNAPSPTAGSAPIISPSIAWSPSNILSPADSATTPAPTTAVIGSAPSLAPIAEAPSLAPIAEAPSLAPTTAAISSAPSTATIGLFCAAFLSIVTTFLV